MQDGSVRSLSELTTTSNTFSSFRLFCKIFTNTFRNDTVGILTCLNPYRSPATGTAQVYLLFESNTLVFGRNAYRSKSGEIGIRVTPRKSDILRLKQSEKDTIIFREGVQGYCRDFNSISHTETPDKHVLGSALAELSQMRQTLNPHQTAEAMGERKTAINRAGGKRFMTL